MKITASTKAYSPSCPYATAHGYRNTTSTSKSRNRIATTGTAPAANHRLQRLTDEEHARFPIGLDQPRVRPEREGERRRQKAPEPEGPEHDEVQRADAAALELWTGRLVERLHKAPELADVTSDLQIKSPQVFVDIDRDKAQQLGVSINDVFTAMQALLAPSHGPRSTTAPQPS